nr:Gldg family protein [Bacteroidota bacterium]
MEDKLAEMRIYSNGNLGYEFIDAAAIENEQQREALYKQLYQKGLMPTTLQLKENDASTQKIIFPGAIINSNNLEQAITFLQEQMGVGDAQMLNNSIRNLEYQITSTVKKITQKAPYQLCFPRRARRVTQRACGRYK